MLRRLFPREGQKFFELFDQHAARTLEAAKLLRAMLHSPGELEEQAKQIKAIEHEGDHITRTTIETLQKTFITPIDRGDIHRLISRLDDVLDLIDSTAERVWLYEFGDIQPDARDLADVLVNAVGEVHKAMTQLRDLRDGKAIIRIRMEVSRYEHEGDALMRRAVARLFREASDPITAIKWKEIYEYLESAIDRCQDVANVLVNVALEYA
jgi:uncharacterized protein